MTMDRQDVRSRKRDVPTFLTQGFTGKKYPKAKHRFTISGAPFLAIAGIWRDGKAGAPPAFTMLTTSPGPDVEPYHSRQIVVLGPEDWGAWIYLTKPEKELLRPHPDRCTWKQFAKEATDEPTHMA